MKIKSSFSTTLYIYNIIYYIYPYILSSFLGNKSYEWFDIFKFLNIFIVVLVLYNIYFILNISFWKKKLKQKQNNKNGQYFSYLKFK